MFSAKASPQKTSPSDSGQIIIEGLFLFILFFAFLSSMLWLEETARDEIQSHRLQKKTRNTSRRKKAKRSKGGKEWRRSYEKFLKREL